MQKSMFFNSSQGDRVYKAEDWADYFSSFIGNGVFPNPSSGLQRVFSPVKLLLLQLMLQCCIKLRTSQRLTKRALALS